MDAGGRAGGALPGAAAPRAVRGDEPLDRLRRRHLPAQGPQGRRLPARAHPRGDVHPPRQGPVLLVQGPAAVDLPDPDEVPRRGASARGHHPRPRVRHEGLLQLRRRRRRAGGVLRAAPARLHQDLRRGSGWTSSSSRRCPGRWAARAARSSCTPRPSARTPSSARPAATPRTPRRSRRWRRPRDPLRRAARRARRGHPGHPDDRHAGRRRQRASTRAPTGRGRRRTR